MRIRADEHVSQEIVRVVRETVLSPSWELSHVVTAGFGGASDPYWITKFKEEGGDAILTGDTDFCEMPPQIVAVFQTGMRVIHLPHKWCNAKCHLQAAHILIWWKRIEATVASMQQKECYRPPWNIAEDKIQLKKVDLDFQSASKKIAKAAKKSSP